MEENKTVVVGRLLLYRGPLYRGYTVLGYLYSTLSTFKDTLPHMLV